MRACVVPPLRSTLTSASGRSARWLTQARASLWLVSDACMHTPCRRSMHKCIHASPQLMIALSMPFACMHTWRQFRDCALCCVYCALADYRPVPCPAYFNNKLNPSVQKPRCAMVCTVKRTWMSHQPEASLCHDLHAALCAEALCSFPDVCVCVCIWVAY